MGKKILLIVGGNPKIDWFKVFENETINGDELKIEMAMWDDVRLNAIIFILIKLDSACKLFGFWVR